MSRLTRYLTLGLVAASLTACVETGLTPIGGDSSAGTTSAYKEYLVLGGARMSYEDCKARRGLLIHDQGSPMYACDPSVTVNAQIDESQEFAHPADPVATPGTL